MYANSKKEGFHNVKRIFVFLVVFFGIQEGFADVIELPRKIIVFQKGFSNPIAQAALLKQFGAVPVKPLRIVNGFAVSLPETAQNMLEKRLGIEINRIAEDIVFHGTGKPGDPVQPPQVLPWGVDRIEADMAWIETNGTMVNVAILDTGAYLDHLDLASNIKGNYNAIHPRKSADDDNGHGTHVAGIIAAANNDIGVVGVGPMVNLYPVKVLGRDKTRRHDPLSGEIPRNDRRLLCRCERAACGQLQLWA
ncbi:MAG: S8 family serine peptidase [Campylobacterales bacterium]|nr:S8 family serine peptidase [Campylobacterales bacterium]